MTTTRWWGPSIADRFDRDANPINAMRLVAAYLVLVSHAWELGGFGKDPLWELSGTTMGTAAVLFFFVLSGFLVTPSLQRSRSIVDYAAARALRIMPAFWVALVVVAFAMAPLAWWHERGGPGGFLSSSPSPFTFVLENALLKIRQWDIGGLLAANPHPDAWNGSLWTLFYEALAYVVLVPLLLVGALGKRRWILPVAVGGLLAALALGSLAPEGSRLEATLTSNGVFLVAAFLVGSLAWVYRDRIPASPVMAAVGIALFVVASVVGGGQALLVVSFGLITASAVCGRFLTGMLRRNDVSYGLYIYAFPVQQLLALWGAHEWGLVPYIALTTPIVFGLAALSWRFVEKPAIGLKQRLRARRPAPAAAS